MEERGGPGGGRGTGESSSKLSGDTHSGMSASPWVERSTREADTDRLRLSMDLVGPALTGILVGGELRLTSLAVELVAANNRLLDTGILDSVGTDARRGGLPLSISPSFLGDESL